MNAGMTLNEDMTPNESHANSRSIPCGRMHYERDNFRHIPKRLSNHNNYLHGADYRTPHPRTPDYIQYYKNLYKSWVECQKNIKSSSMILFSSYSLPLL
jgi:hypothetical protein